MVAPSFIGVLVSMVLIAPPCFWCSGAAAGVDNRSAVQSNVSRTALPPSLVPPLLNGSVWFPPRPRPEPPSPPASFFESLEDNVVLYTILTKPIGRYCEALLSAIWNGFTPHIVCWGCPDMPDVDSTSRRIDYALTYFRHAPDARWTERNNAGGERRSEIVVFHYDGTDVFFLSSRRSILRAASRTSWPYVKFDGTNVNVENGKPSERVMFEAQWALEHSREENMEIVRVAGATAQPMAATITGGGGGGEGGAMPTAAGEMWRFPPGVMLISSENHCFARFTPVCDDGRMRRNANGKKRYLNSGLWVAGAYTTVKYLEQVRQATVDMPVGSKCDQCVMIFLMGLGYAADGAATNDDMAGGASTTMRVMLLDSNNSVFQSSYQRDWEPVYFDTASGRFINTANEHSRVKILHLNGPAKVVYPVMEPYLPWYYFSQAAASVVAHVPVSALSSLSSNASLLEEETSFANFLHFFDTPGGGHRSSSRKKRKGTTPRRTGSPSSAAPRPPAAPASKRRSSYGRMLSTEASVLSPFGRRQFNRYVNRLRKTAQFWDSLAAARVYVDGVAAAFEDVCPGFVAENRPEVKIPTFPPAGTHYGPVKPMRITTFPPTADIDDSEDENFNDFGNLFQALRVAAAVGAQRSKEDLALPASVTIMRRTGGTEPTWITSFLRRDGVSVGITAVGVPFVLVYVSYLIGGRPER